MKGCLGLLIGSLCMLSSTAQAICVEGYTPKLGYNSISIENSYQYELEDFKRWLRYELGDDISIENQSNYKNAFVLKSTSGSLYRSYLCELGDGIQLIISPFKDQMAGQAYKFVCDKKVSIETQYDGVYPTGVIAYCK